MCSASAEFSLAGGATPLQPLRDARLAAAGVEILVKREDLRDPELGGNKWHKLRGHLMAARAASHGRLLSFGGAWSNHLHALAAAGRRFGFATVGVVRGNRESAMLDDCRQQGMTIVPLGYAEYRHRNNADWLASLQQAHGPCHVIPEGGGGAAGLTGFAALADEICAQAGADLVVATAMGTGTTLAGLARHLPATSTVWGFPVLRVRGLEAGGEGDRCRVWQGLVDDAYGRLDTGRRRFLAAFEQEQGIPLDPVYTVKLFEALFGLVEQGKIPSGTRIVALHSGGLQGRRGFALPDRGCVMQAVRAA